MVLEELRSRAGGEEEQEAAQSRVWRADRQGREVLFARPVLYMNRSGPAVRALVERQGVSNAGVLVVCDDFHLEFGRLRLRKGGSHGGHNGLRSVIAALGATDFPRLRIGIGAAPSGEDPADFVLERFASDERKRLDAVVDEAADCVEIVLDAGMDAGMNRYNRTPGGEPGAPVT